MCLQLCAVAAGFVVGFVGTAPSALARSDVTYTLNDVLWEIEKELEPLPQHDRVGQPFDDTAKFEAKYAALAAALRDVTSCQRSELKDYLTKLFLIRQALHLIRKRDGLNLNSDSIRLAEFWRRVDRHTQLESTVDAAIAQLLEDFLRRCCGKEICSDSSRPPTGDSVGQQQDTWTPGPAGQPRETSRSGDGIHLTPGGADGTGTPLTPPQDPTTGQPPTAGTPPPTGQPPPTSRPPTTGLPPLTGQLPPTTEQPPTTGTPPETGQHPSDTAPFPPQPPITGDGQRTADICCEACPGTDRDRFYFPLPPDTDCQPGDVRRDDLSVAGGTCANPLVERPGPATYGDACCDKKPAQVLYDSVSSDGVTSQVGSVLRSTCGEDPCAGKSTVRGAGIPTHLEISILSTGPDTHGRNWVPESPILRLGKEHLRPCHTEPLYVIKESSAKVAAVALITAIGSQYEEDARRAEASPGSACHAQEDHRSPAKKAADRAARGAAMGLLASQAKGQIEGLRATFNVTGREQQLQDATLQALIVNEITQQKVPMRLPVRFERDDAGSP